MKFKTASLYKDRVSKSLTIKNIKAKRINRDEVDLILNFEKNNNNSYGAQNINKSIKLGSDIDSSGQIIKCYSSLDGAIEAAAERSCNMLGGEVGDIFNERIFYNSCPSSYNRIIRRTPMATSGSQFICGNDDDKQKVCLFNGTPFKNNQYTSNPGLVNDHPNDPHRAGREYQIYNMRHDQDLGGRSALSTPQVKYLELPFKTCSLKVNGRSDDGHVIAIFNLSQNNKEILYTQRGTDGIRISSSVGSRNRTTTPSGISHTNNSCSTYQKITLNSGGTLRYCLNGDYRGAGEINFTSSNNNGLGNMGDDIVIVSMHNGTYRGEYHEFSLHAQKCSN